MKHTGKQGKRSGPAGYRTPSTFLHRKALNNAFAKANTKKFFSSKPPFPPQP